MDRDVEQRCIELFRQLSDDKRELLFQALACLVAGEPLPGWAQELLRQGAGDD